MQQRRYACALAVDQPHRPRAVGVRQLHGLAVLISVTSELGQPIREGQRRIAKRPCERITEIGRRRIRPQLDKELAESRAGKPVMKESDQEGDRRDAQCQEGGPADLCDDRTAKRHRDEEEGDHHEAKRECVGEESQRASQRPASSASSDGKDAESGQAKRADRHQLNPKQDFAHAGLGRNLEQVIWAEAPDHHPNELERQRGHVRSPDEGPLNPPVQPTARIRKEHVQEEDGWQKVERLPDRVREVARRPGEVG